MRRSVNYVTFSGNYVTFLTIKKNNFGTEFKGKQMSIDRVKAIGEELICWLLIISVVAFFLIVIF
jgi:hypothetical protein